MTAEHLRLVLESVPDTAAFHRAAQDLARAEIPPDVLALLRMGRLTALQKPGGGVRGIVCGDLVRRLVAQQISSAVEEATSPFQYALTTKTGGECVAHAIQSLTDLDSRATVLSIDGFGAFDTSAAVLDGLQQVRGGDTVLPIVLQFYSDTRAKWVSKVMLSCPCCTPSDNVALCSLFKISCCLIFAYLDDMYVVCLPDRVGPIFKHFQEALEQYARIQVHLGKTQVWNRGGHVPPACVEMQAAADQNLARCWTSVTARDPCAGHPDWPPGVCAGRTPGHHRGTQHSPQSDSSGQDLQSAWLLLLFCANTCATCSLRGIPPAETEQFRTRK